ncbi:MAG: triphosphoribosyl-dephospho-CoA synthase [Pirellulales bacterium]
MSRDAAFEPSIYGVRRPLRRAGDDPWPIEAAAVLACSLEAAAPKAGNVHPSAGFRDMSFTDFLIGAALLAPVFRNCTEQSVGSLVLNSMTVVRERIGVNTILGTLILLAPLAKAAADQRSIRGRSLHECTRQVLRDLTAEDANCVYEAIRLAAPGGLGSSTSHDVHQAPPPSLIEAMRAAPPCDTVAKQYADGYSDLFLTFVPWLRELSDLYADVREVLVALQLRILSQLPDGLIVRKAGEQVAATVMPLAAAAFAEFPVHRMSSNAFQQLDAYLRSDGHRFNPGTTADLIAATLFVYLVDDAQ